jgi:hypothetical protein
VLAGRDKKNYHKIRAYSVLGASLVALIGFLVTPGMGNDATVRSIIVAVFAFIIIERFGELFSAYQADDESAEISKFFSEVPILLSQTHDLVYFPTSSAGCEICIDMAKTASHVRNTVLSYGDPATLIMNSDVYGRWLAAKKDAIARLVPFHEIFSTHINSDDPQMLFAHSTKGGNYRPRAIDDRIVPMVQMSISDFPDHAVVVFGWIFPGVEEGFCFLSRNVKLVQYFRTYFDYHFHAFAKDI